MTIQKTVITIMALCSLLMATHNKEFDNLPDAYLFSKIGQRTKSFQEAHPGVEVLKLGIGNTTENLTPTVIRGLHSAIDKLANPKTYTGYGDEQGDMRLRQALAGWYEKLGVSLDPTEIFISDGAKPDTANIQQLFDPNNKIAIQNPVYPVYLDSNVIAGKTGKLQPTGLYQNVFYMPCTEENGFIPQVPEHYEADLTYICSPNNPTGSVANHAQLEKFVDYARDIESVVIFDSAYALFVNDSKLPRSIYEINDSKRCAIEIGSFSKMAGFTGVRLGWTVVPHDLKIENTVPGKLNQMWNRRQTTMFNGASNIAQEGGLAALTEEGQKECQGLVDFYMGNATIIKEGLKGLGLTVFGGENAPYLWLKTPGGMDSWAFFDKLLNETHVVGTPGVGFGSCGEGYFRLSAFGHRENILKAVESIKDNLQL